MADLRKEQRIKSSDIKNNPLKGKRKKKEVLKGTRKNLYTKAAERTSE